MQSKIRKSFRTEMLAAGLYQTLAGQCAKNNPELSAMFKAAGEQEYRHGLLFAQHYYEVYGYNLGSGGHWFAFGKRLGRIMAPLPLRVKTRRLCAKEAEAVKMIETELTNPDDSSYHKLLKVILPDEQEHAGLYQQFFHS